MHVITYVTSSEFKIQENREFSSACRLRDGSYVKDNFKFEYRCVPIKEILEVDLAVMVTEEAVKAYSEIKVPCIVEHAGLIFEGYERANYPGGLTKPMWNALGEKFSAETMSSGRRAIARAVVAYCDGKGVKTFVGETPGELCETARGNREFYWDTIFIPDCDDPAAKGQTYAEIADHPDLGLRFKVKHLSQSSKAMLKFLEYLQQNPGNDLWAKGT